MTSSLGLAACIALALGVAQDPAPQVPAGIAAPAKLRTHGRLPWFAGSYEQLGAKAKAEQRAVMIYLWADGCRWCPRLESEALSDPELAAALQGVLAWHSDGQQAAGKMLAQRFGAGAFPVLLFFDSAGRGVDRLDGYFSKARFFDEVARVLRNEGTLPDLARQLAQNPEDLGLRTRYASKLEALGDTSGRDEQIEELRRRDQKRTSLPLRRELYLAQLAAIEQHHERTREINPGPLVRFLEAEQHPALLYEGYSALASMHLQRAGELERAQQLQAASAKRADLRAVLAKAAEHLPENPAGQVGFALDTIATFARFPSDLSDGDRTLALKLASLALALLPEEARVQACSALASYFNADKLGAAAALRRAIELEPGNSEWTALAQSLGL